LESRFGLKFIRDHQQNKKGKIEEDRNPNSNLGGCRRKPTSAELLSKVEQINRFFKAFMKIVSYFQPLNSLSRAHRFNEKGHEEEFYRRRLFRTSP
jgi:hypothetical protein